MSPFPVTLATTALLALLFLLLSFRVVGQRDKAKIGLGDGSASDVALGAEASAPGLLVATRAHANFAEYVPLSLLLMGMIEMSGGYHWVVVGLGGALILARVGHMIGIGRNAPNPFRFGGVILQWLMLLVGAIYGLVLVAPNV